MNVQMRIITDENVDQLLSMSYSNNMNKLLKTNEPIETALKNAWTKLSQELKQNKGREILYESPVLPEPVNLGEMSPEFNPELSGQFNPESPAYAPGTPPQFTESSPQFNPESSPQFNPATPPEFNPAFLSPQFNPESPAYAPGSPATFEYTPIVQEFGKEPTILEVEAPPTEETKTSENETASSSSSSEVKPPETTESSEGTKKITL
jgi:hypothetical protein